MNAGGLAQMTYNGFQRDATPSYGSRGKGSHLRNISVTGTPAPSENQPVPTPRTARSQLLAGLRTAPKTPTPSSAADHGYDNHDNSRYTGISVGWTGLNTGNTSMGPRGQRLPTPPTSSSPAIQVNDGDVEEYEWFDEMNSKMGGMMLNQNAAQYQNQISTAAKVQQLQHQLAQLQMQQAAYSATPPMSPGLAMYGNNASMQYNNPQYQYGAQGNGFVQQFTMQQLQHVYQLQQLQLQHQAQQAAALQIREQQIREYQAQRQQQQQRDQQYQQPIAQVEVNPQNNRSGSPPKLNHQQSSNNINNSQAPSVAANSSAAAGFRRGHRKASSLSTCTIVVNNAEVAEAPRTSLPNLNNIPTTPMTATFAPGHASGTHPTRQPRGPPSIEELKAKPTSKDEGSKNFATRQRRRAVSKLVSASTERRTARSTSGTASAGGTMTPVSENEDFAFQETESVASGQGRNSRQSQRDDNSNNNSSDEGSAKSGNRFGKKSLRPVLAQTATDKRRSAMF
ncbi:hypothetical protein BZA77DRAFT_103403 [Pyronema omphalodes]|nr:hypothetical protein BZA77DRAFT_103403 [Pyronema omphalodes]